jgi:nicotinamidase/pyrazinamidase
MKSAKLSESALLLVDVQNDFCPGGSLPVAEGDAVVPVLNGIMPGFPRVIATQDWHPAGHVSFASSHPGRRPLDTVRLAAGEQMLWPDHCLAGSPGADFHPALETEHVSLILRKGTRAGLDSYSAFLENDRTTATGLEHYLRGLGLQHLFVAGLATDVCVYHTIRDGLRLGFSVYLVEDAARGIDTPPGSLQARLAELEEAGAARIESRSLFPAAGLAWRGGKV